MIPYVSKHGDELDGMLASAINEDLHELIATNSIQRLGEGKVSHIFPSPKQFF